MEKVIAAAGKGRTRLSGGRRVVFGVTDRSSQPPDAPNLRAFLLHPPPPLEAFGFGTQVELARWIAEGREQTAGSRNAVTIGQHLSRVFRGELPATPKLVLEILSAQTRRGPGGRRELEGYRLALGRVAEAHNRAVSGTRRAFKSARILGAGSDHQQAVIEAEVLDRIRRAEIVCISLGPWSPDLEAFISSPRFMRLMAGKLQEEGNTTRFRFLIPGPRSVKAQTVLLWALERSGLWPQDAHRFEVLKTWLEHPIGDVKKPGLRVSFVPHIPWTDSILVIDPHRFSLEQTFAYQWPDDLSQSDLDHSPPPGRPGVVRYPAQKTGHWVNEVFLPLDADKACQRRIDYSLEDYKRVLEQIRLGHASSTRASSW